MKSLRKNSRNAILILSILALALPGCGDSGSRDSDSSAANILICLFSFFLVCPASARGDAGEGLVAVHNLSASVPDAPSAPEIGLEWRATSEDLPIVGYRIYRDGQPIADTGETEFTDSVVDADTRYCYQITAYDERRNASAPSETVCATTSWVIATVAAGLTAPRAALALDALDRVHIAYLGYDQQGLREFHYANRLSGQWRGEDTGFAGPVIAEDLSLIVDDSGSVHIGSLDNYLTNGFGDWHREMRVAHNFAVMSLDSTGYVHAVSGNEDGGFSHASNVGGGWGYQPIDDGEWQRLAAIVDGFDIMHIAYYNYAAGELRYLNNRAGSWSGEVIADQLALIWRLELAVDSTGAAHLVYQQQVEDSAGTGGGNGLVYASNAGGDWQRQLVDAGGGGGGAALAIDAGSHLHISYRGADGSELRYLTNVSGTWESTVIDDLQVDDGACGPIVDLCGATDIAVDSSGQVHISYSAADHVRHASRR